jgi:hypothetical protein
MTNLNRILIKREGGLSAAKGAFHNNRRYYEVPYKFCMTTLINTSQKGGGS